MKGCLKRSSQFDVPSANAAYLRDVIVLDTFPMVTDVFMDRLGKKDQAQFVDEALKLTVQCLRCSR
ncbi:hypothetical protein N7444_009589 [Penicillium canescens]|nr:hypothetical protein N7444_009589 [Penicillium canescens]